MILVRTTGTTITTRKNDGHMDGYQVVPEQLRSAANEITDAVESADGMALETIPGRKASYGHAGVAESLSYFCATWDLATQSLQQYVQSAAETLRSAAGQYEQQDSDAAAAVHTAETAR